MPLPIFDWLAVVSFFYQQKLLASESQSKWKFLGLSPDGYLKPLGQVFNDTFPGPLIEACWGDTITIHVTNLEAKEGSTVHWHGIRQLGTNQMDGVNGVTQCPIAQNGTFTYKFNVEQYGHTWYHSHYQVQYSDGVMGPLSIYGPSSANYDEALEPIMMSDWVHDNASVSFLQELNGGIPVMDSLILGGNGQRYEVIVQANPLPGHEAADGNYWIRTRVAAGCGNVVSHDENTGILRYNASSTANPTTTALTLRTECVDEQPDNLVPVVPWTVKNLQGNINDFTFEADLSNVKFEGGFFRWDLLDQPLFLNYSDPTILHADNPSFRYNDSYCIVPYNFTQGFVYLVITGENLNKIAKRPVPAAHPIHLHGHDFVILAQEDHPFNATTEVPKFKYDNPTRRDVALLYGGGYLALAFKPDNPGVWLVHCHIAFHASSGLALQILERQDEIIGSLGGAGALAGTKSGCEGWDKWNLQIDQDDSGI
ncbi:hypothetical protein M8818_007008 [Zalaria obscura]|uniref:Uncharacterized protein n=1 Tax=Zalaria obscura TaxID=2024903 RepID=A0ACC3S422_9PEZI